MIRTRKPVKLLEWGEGTNTTNQVWTVTGEGRIVKRHCKLGRTTLVIQLNAPFNPKNSKDNSVKIVQEGEGMSAHSKHWGEVASGIVKLVESGGTVVQVEIANALNIDSRRSAPAWENG